MKKLLAKSLTAGLLAGMLAAPVTVPVYAQEATEQTEAAAPAEHDHALLSINGKEYDLAKLRVLYSMRPTADIMVSPEEIGTADEETLLKVGRTIGAYEFIAKDARESGLELDEEQKSQVEQTVAAEQNRLLYKELILDNMGEPNDEDLKAAYERDKDERYRQEEELRLRQIFITRYVPHVVKPGETLEQVAKEIAGSEDAVPTILSDATKRPRVEDLEEADKPVAIEGEDVPVQDTGEKLPPRALVEGEVLLIPVSGEQAEKISDRAQEAYQKLKDGTAFLEVAEEYSDNERPGEQWVIRPERQDRPIMAEIRDAFMALEDEAYSEPIETKHGYHIIYRDAYRAGGHRPFEEVRETLVANYSNERQQELVNEFFAKQLSNEAVKLNLDPFTAAEDAATPEDVLATIDGKDFTRGQLASEARETFPSNADEESVKKYLQSAVSVQMALVDLHKKNAGYDEKEEFALVRNAAEETLLSRNYLMKQADEAVEAATDEEIKSWYEENKEQSFKVRESFELITLVKQFEGGEDDEAAQAEARAALEAELANVASEEDFKAVVSRVAPANDPRTSRVVRRNTQASQLEQADLEAVRGTEVPGVSDIVARNNELLAYWVASKQEESYRPLEEVRDQIAQNLAADRKNVYVEETVASYRQRADVKVLAHDHGHSHE